MPNQFFRWVGRVCLFLASAYLLTGNAIVAQSAHADFEDVAEIFAEHCIRCHNDVDREGEISLQSADSFVANEFATSSKGLQHLLSVIVPTDGRRARMPDNSPPLSDSEVDKIRAWIQRGAIWPEGKRIIKASGDFDWWSFRPLVRPRVPKIASNWIRTPIDAFVLAMHRQRGLAHVGQADRRTLIRRLHYDLVGLPPTPEEVNDFVGDSDPRAYEQLVDRLLDSPHYGERWARHWLDVVKYADTCGYDKDKLRANAWPYRDYVIRSFNDDKPYGRFVQEQIAGDVLFPGDPDGILGLGFIAAGPWDHIGHVEVPEAKLDGMVARNLDRDEMVSNTFNTFCSVTIQCARCHRHKFDPFTQQHYYGLQSLFSAVDRADRPYDLDPVTQQQRLAIDSRLRALKSDKADLEKEIAEAGGAEFARLSNDLVALRTQLKVVKPPEYGYHSAFAKTPDVNKWVEVDLGQPTEISQVILRPCHDEFGGIGAGFGFPRQFRVETKRRESDSYEPLWSTGEDFPNPLLSSVEIDGHHRIARFVRVSVTKLTRRSDTFMFALAECEVIDGKGVNVALQQRVSARDSIENPDRWSAENLVDGKWAKPDDPAIHAKLRRTAQEHASIKSKIETADRVKRRDEISAAIRRENKLRDSLPAGKLVYAAATHFKSQGNFKPTLGKPRPVFVLHRGEVSQPREEAPPSLLPLGEQDSWQLGPNLSESERRAALARWMTRQDHPLVWRSIVNRIWQHHFGTGLVASSNDFGRMGSVPTHPRLLDWLAAEFRDGGQSIKQLHRTIVTSSTYRQSSQAHMDNSARDPSNRYLWRMTRRRLAAEEIRDSILAVSGSLDTTMGGPGFYLFQLERPEHSPHYEYFKFDPTDPASHRRSIYRFVVRSQPDPFMTTFDCADSSQSTPKRTETLTSLQALTLLNSRFNLVMASRFATRLRTQRDSLPAQVRSGFELVAARPPTDDEQASMVGYAEKHGLENLCRLMFNLNEFVFLD